MLAYVRINVGLEIIVPDNVLTDKAIVVDVTIVKLVGIIVTDESVRIADNALVLKIPESG